MGSQLLLEQSEGKLDDAAEKISEVLIEDEGLHPRKDCEGEAFEHLLKPHLVAGPSIDMSHRR